MSGELHKANHTIATAFPDQIQYSLLEEDDDNLPKAFTTVDRCKIHKSTVEGLMKKKHGEKSRLKDSCKKSAAPISKDNAQAEISRLQKEILVLQTEKEFIKSSYESVELQSTGILKSKLMKCRKKFATSKMSSMKVQR
jgi:putative cell wall-binding protein